MPNLNQSPRPQQGDRVHLRLAKGPWFVAVVVTVLILASAGLMPDGGYEIQYRTPYGTYTHTFEPKDVRRDRYMGSNGANPPER
ncbi:hypothetical protein DL93DRAFT_2233149 [Clavulina sp. PMI_390]|nr:hypothetical protein DL93DRAFT_2233149 [Clavulina sp. PMI_390]